MSWAHAKIVLWGYYDHPHLTLLEQSLRCFEITNRHQSDCVCDTVLSHTNLFQFLMPWHHQYDLVWLFNFFWSKVCGQGLIMRGLLNSIDWLIVIDGPFATQLLPISLFWIRLLWPSLFASFCWLPDYVLSSGAQGRLQWASCGTFACWFKACRGYSGGYRSCRGAMDIWESIETRLFDYS